MNKNFLAFCLSVLLIFTCVACLNQNKKEDNSTPISTNEYFEETNDKEIDDIDKVQDADEIKNNNSSNSNEIKDDNSSNSNEKIKKETCRLFFFDIKNLNMVYIDKEIEIVDNAKVNALTKAHQETKNENLLNLTDEVGVTSAKLNDDILEVHFNESFTDKMTLGSATESGLAASLINTYGYNYNVTKVAIYINNELYTGLKGELEEGYYTVDFSDAQEFKKE